jgi:23S rRNA (uracil1939-C5)-methyltransferase
MRDGIPCPHYPRCDGCPLVGTPYAAQLRRKRDSVRAALAAAGLDAEPLPIVGARTPFGYRNQAKLVLRRTRAGVMAGLYAPGTHRVVDARACAVHHPALNRVTASVLALLDRGGPSIYDERRAAGALRYLVVRYSFWQRRTQVTLVTAEPITGIGKFVRALRRRCPALAGVVLNVNETRGNVIFGSRWVTLGGEAAVVDRINGLALQARPGSFVQANPWIAGRLYRTAARWAEIRPGDTVVDLHTGIGGLALSLAPGARRVFAVEENEMACGDARSNARRNGIGQLRVLAGGVERVLPELGREIAGADVVALNPPRAGVSPEVLAAVAALRPRRVLYLSCDARTLAHDLARLGPLGYRTVRVLPADMLPQTDHVECLALAVPFAEPYGRPEDPATRA